MTRKLFWLALATAAILLVPAVAMQFTDEVDWSAGDFAAAGLLLFGSGLFYLLLARRIDDARYRLVLKCAICAAVLVLWAQLAVGIV
jgi:hypothetical protein